MNTGLAAIHDPGITDVDPVERTLLIVDDEPQVIKSIVRLFKQDSLRVMTAGSGAEGLDIVANNAVSVVLSDQNMPLMDGICFLEKVRLYDADIVRLLITGYSKIDSAIDAINRSQIFEYLTKPWEPEDLKNAVQRALDHYQLTKENRRLQSVTLAQNAELRMLNDTLEEKVRKRTVQLADAVREGVVMLAVAAEARDDNTGDHVKRIRHLSRSICLKMGMREADADRIGFFSMMHDVGKIHIPDKILNKRGPLDAQEWRIMKAHTVAGEKILGISPYYALARQIARSHHEWMDGNGYPDGLKGIQIPLAARVVAVADVYDALTHARPYKEAWSSQEALDELNRLAGRQFDTDIVNAFVEIVADGSIDDMEN